MKTKLLITLFLFTSLFSFSQQLTYKYGGRIFDSKNQKMSPTEVRELLAKQPGLLNYYNTGRTKKTVGSVMLYGGFALLATDFLIAASTESGYPTALTYVSIASIIIAIPVKIGYSKKIKTVVKDYNLLEKPTTFTVEKINFVSNKNAIGVALTF
ncbi:hypothetical protein [Flavobacterium sp. GT3R68]|uniref:hypothetical protein n=1 Tax=Flavobacterium sp. GT3R68 TaxID=2594437 RepID=UPI001185130D|nr:hypothetical protein [Flavobacterium sp. GT3R68]TRW91039.1 hypothetical protein FNW07_09415 [Flavobacterium sp. GT3R68]